MDSHKAINPNSNFDSKPIYLGNLGSPKTKHKLQFDANGFIRVSLDNKTTATVPPTLQSLDVATETISGLLEDLQPGSKLADLFMNSVWKEYEASLLNTTPGLIPSFGHLFYYPHSNRLAAFAPEEWHKHALISRNSLLIRDPKQSITIEQQQHLFQNVVIGSSGASVGRNAFMACLKTLANNKAKIADPRAYKTTNMNRTEIPFWAIGMNKAEAAALIAYEFNPYLKIYAYKEGLHQNNFQTFLEGNAATDEPKLDFIFDESDDPDVKVETLIRSRNARINLFRISDIGVGYQIDFRNWKKYPDLSLSYGVSDEQLLDSQQKWREDMANRELFIHFSRQLMGNNLKKIPEVDDLVEKRLDSPYSGSIPQIGIAAYTGGNHMALLIAMNVLGYKIPERIFVDLRKGKIESEGKWT